MKEDGITPKGTRYQTEKQFLRNAIDDAASTARSPEEFSKILDEKYHIIFKISRNRYSYLHPVRKKYITGSNLGTRYTEDFLLKAFEENTKSHREQKEEIWEQQTPNTSTDLPSVPCCRCIYSNDELSFFIIIFILCPDLFTVHRYLHLTGCCLSSSLKDKLIGSVFRY